MPINKSLVYLVQSWGDAHEMNRINYLSNYINSYKVFASVRHDVKYDYGIKCDKNFGYIQNVNYKNRIIHYFKCIIFLYKDIRENNNIYFIQGTDLLFVYNIARFFARKPPNFIYQISDLRQILTKRNSLFSSVIRFWDTIFIKKSLLVLTTSSYFIDGFYTFISNYLIIENKLTAVTYSNNYKIDEFVKNSNKIVIGYFGIIRCETSLKFLIELASKNDKFEVVIRGYFVTELESYIPLINSLPNITYKGDYISPINLKQIYEEVDLVWVCYTFNHSLNMHLARTNRFYEAGFFNKIMICQAGTKDAFHSSELNVCIEINLNDFNIAFKTLSVITKDIIHSLKKNYLNISESKFKITNDYDLLIKKVNAFLNNTK